MKEDGVPLPFVYAFLSGKETQQYYTILQAVKHTVEQYWMNACNPELIMTDFEKTIINACAVVLPNIAVTGCFFYLLQSIYRKIESEGLQVAYNNPADCSIRQYSHVLAALSYIPVIDLPRVFNLLKANAPNQLVPVMNYFQEYYVLWHPARGQRRAVPPQFPPTIWNQHKAAIGNTAKTNNASEGWHNRFHLLLGKNHPDFYVALNEFQKEQDDTAWDVQYRLALNGSGWNCRKEPQELLTSTKNTLTKKLEWNFHVQ